MIIMNKKLMLLVLGIVGLASVEVLFMTGMIPPFNFDYLIFSFLTASQINH